MFSKIKKENDKKYKFYLCPISKDAICEECYNNNNIYEVNYPFNLLYISCKNENFFEHLSKDNILVFRDKIKYEKHPEITDEICDMCSGPLCKIDFNDKNRINCFYIIVNIIRKNNFLICNNCFELLIDEKRNWYFNNKYSYINDLILNSFIDLDNLIFKKVIYN